MRDQLGRGEPYEAGADLLRRRNDRRGSRRNRLPRRDAGGDKQGEGGSETAHGQTMHAAASRGKVADG